MPSVGPKPPALLEDLESELKDLAAIDPCARDTTLLIAPDCLADFLDFNDFVALADAALVNLELDGVLQIASLHPDYQFAGTRADDITNYTNRSPYPTLHLLREDSIDRAVDAFPQAETIYERNMETMQQLGRAGWAALGVGRSAGCPARRERQATCRSWPQWSKPNHQFKKKPAPRYGWRCADRAGTRNQTGAVRGVAQRAAYPDP